MLWDSRVKLYHAFEKHMIESGVKLTTVECALGQRPFELSNPAVNHVKVRHKTLPWNKENLINLGVAAALKSDPSAEYLCWNDADIEFLDPQWAVKTVHALQQYAIIQPWSDAYDLGPGGRHNHMAHHQSFCYRWWNHQLTDNKAYDVAHPGYSWAIRREAFEEVGGLIETAALGAGDRHMSLALIGEVLKQIAPGISDAYKRPLLQWQALALKYINKNIGFVPGTINHFFHGRKVDRQYWSRWQILVRNQFDPSTDLKKNAYGVIELAGNKPRLAHDLDHYLRQRAEDGNVI